jgi:uncharacterized protein YcbK (DUF882 family)
LRYLLVIFAFLIGPAAHAGDPPASGNANAAVATDTPAVATTNATTDALPEYRLRLYHTHTDEHIDIVYKKGDAYIPEAIEQLDYFLRDSRNGTVRPFDPRLFDLLNELTASVGRPDAEINVVCGYRTPETNRALRRRSRRVAKHSLHMQAMAIDIRIPGVTTKELRNAALELHEGGVGYYRRKAFVHVDVGPVRKW